jgi:hypothetical protein
MSDLEELGREVRENLRQARLALYDARKIRGEAVRLLRRARLKAKRMRQTAATGKQA